MTGGEIILRSDSGSREEILLMATGDSITPQMGMELCNNNYN